jgi:DNA-binding CsgD family transcriptional regulator
MEKLAKLPAGLLPNDALIEIFTSPDGRVFMQRNGKTTPYGQWPQEVMDFLWEVICKDRAIFRELTAISGSKREIIRMFCERYLADYDNIPDIDLLKRVCNKELKPLGKLTAREVEVIKFLASHDNEKDAPEVLGITVNTVKSHKNKIYRKMDFHSKNDVTKFALRHNLTTLL